MLKMDFLGLTTLTVIHDTLAAIQQRTGVVIDADVIPLDDEKVYQMLRAGRTIGVFQFESPLATDMLRSMRCDRFGDLVASSALMRPGPLDAGMHRVYQRRKRGEEPVVYVLPELEPILEPTYGVITYQEQVMRSRWRVCRSPRRTRCKAVGRRTLKRQKGSDVRREVCGSRVATGGP
jgi:DNA polymerase-3 subunit alpha